MTNKFDALTIDVSFTEGSIYSPTSKGFVMNIKRYFASATLLFLFVFFYEAFVHGKLLTTLYMQTPNLWRSYQDMQSFLPFNTALEVVIALWLTFIFTQLFKTGGWKNGLKFGMYFGVLSAIQASGAYFYLPISCTLAASWFISMLIEGILGGLILGLVYHK